MKNPLLSPGLELAFDELRAEQVEPAITTLLDEARAALDVVARQAGPRTYANTLGALEAATVKLEEAMSVVEHLENVATTPALREAHNAVLPEVSAFWSSIPLHAGLYRALEEYARTSDAAGLDPVRRRFLDKTLDDFRRHGAELDEAGKARLAAIDLELSETTTRFSQNLLDATAAWELVIEDETMLAGLPESARELARDSAEQKGRPGWRFTLQAPSVTAVLTYLDDRGTREAVWRAQDTRAARAPFDNRPLITKILELRRERARLLGFASFVDLVLADRMAKTAATARAFVEDLTRRTRAAFEREQEELLSFRRGIEGPDAPPLEPWDVAYYAELMRKAKYAFDEEELRAYFPVEAALRGAFETAERLYGVRITPNQAVAGWAPEVRGYRLTDADGSELGRFFIDLYPRETKTGGAWMHGLVPSVPPAPHLAVLVTNASPPAGAKPSLLTHREVETLFHEFGHLLHHCLSKVTVRSLSCTRVAGDFVELPSQLMENWCSEQEGLALFARHWQSGEKLPESLLDGLKRVRTYRAATAQMRQLGFATVDLALHMDYDSRRDGDVLAFARGVLEGFSPAPLPDDYAMIATFGHLFAYPVGYAGGYYSYKWAEVLDADAFSRFKERGILSREVGADFRARVLELGDSRDPMELFESFMGRPPRVEALLEREGLA
ncbi:MAG: M3 family metallopeptidase [Sorangiineae bacterium]|nr:M3 family metallopeptidase [Polyangiaceae bacterium]MEB2323625.1 M3 family metallopeptidase [Sorangiineae bacterium]